MAIDVCVILLTISGHMFVIFLAYEVFTQHNIHSFLIDGLSVQCIGSSELNSSFILVQWTRITEFEFCF